MLQKFLDYLLYEKRYSAHTVKAYESDLTQLRDYLEVELDINDPAVAESIHIRSWVAGLMGEGLSSRSIARKMSAAKAYFKWLMKFHGLPFNPAKGVAVPKAPKRLPVYLEEAQMDGLIPPHIFPDTYEGIRDRAVLELFYHTGMRSAELIDLKISSVDFQHGTIKVLGKRNKERMVPVSQSVLHVLSMYLNSRKELPDIKNPACFFLTGKGVKLYPKLVYRLVNHYIGQVSSLQKKSPHVLRHTFATHMLNRGADLNAIKELLGHASLAATQVYTHNSIEQLKEVHRKAHPKG